MSKELIMNPWEISEESTSVTRPPSFTQAKYMLVRLAHPKGKTVRDGVVATLAMISYFNEQDKEVESVQVDQTPSGYEITFPNGKGGIMATKYRGPKSFYKFVNNDTQKWYQIGSNDPVTKINSKCTTEAATAEMSKRIEGWDTLNDAEQNQYIDEYFQSLYMFGLAKDFNLDTESKEDEIPTVGFVTDFYRRYTPPKGDERYGNVTVTKYAKAENKPNLPGEYKLVDAEIAASIYEALTSRDNSAASFDPANFIENKANG